MNANTLLAVSEESKSLCPAAPRAGLVQRVLTAQRRAYDAEIKNRRA